MNYQKIEIPKMTCQTPIDSKIMLPFPPTISASDIINRRKPCRFISKSPNAFLIYRKAFLDQLSLTNHNLRMTEVSKLVSNHWKYETELVKDAYRKISRDVEIELNERRKECVSYRVVWKNSKYSSVRKRNQCGKTGKTTKAKGNKSEVNQLNTKFNPSTSRGNIFYQFVPAFPNVELDSKNSKKKNKTDKTDKPNKNIKNIKNIKTENDKEVVSTFYPENICNSPENSSQNSEFSEHSELSEFNEFNEFNTFSNYQESNYDLQFNQPYTNFNYSSYFNNWASESFIEEQQGHLIFDENIQKNNDIYEIGLDWYLQNFM